MPMRQNGQKGQNRTDPEQQNLFLLSRAYDEHYPLFCILLCSRTEKEIGDADNIALCAPFKSLRLFRLLLYISTFR